MVNEVAALKERSGDKPGYEDASTGNNERPNSVSHQIVNYDIFKWNI